jgi:acyl carrier protein
MPATKTPTTTIEDFSTKLADIMEVDEVRPEDVLKEFGEWDSLTVLSVISMIHGSHGVSLSASDLRQVDTVQALHDLVALKSAEQE